MDLRFRLSKELAANSVKNVTIGIPSLPVLKVLSVNQSEMRQVVGCAFIYSIFERKSPGELVLS
jgi:hypothetical protein